MTNSNAELIEEIICAYKHGSSYNILFRKILTVLESQPFDVLQYLRDGGEIVNENGDIIFSDTAVIPLSEFAAHTWQPYHEPPVEGSREWAMEQDCLVSHVMFSMGGATHSENIAIVHLGYQSSQYDTGWSLYIEPREVGWYAVKQDDANLVLYWNGKMFCFTDLEGSAKQNEACFSWISDKRIELDKPDND